MIKRIVLAIIAVFLAWSILDFVLHVLILGPSYAATASLWRPVADMKMALMKFVTLTVAVCFVFIYTRFRHKSQVAGLSFGALFGLASGMSMGLGTYSVMPIPLTLALSWLAGNAVEGIVAGAIVGAIVGNEASQS